MMVKFKKCRLFMVFVLCFLVSGCGVSMQYTAARDKDGNLLDKFSGGVGVCANCFQRTADAITGDLIYQDIRLRIHPTKQCTNWLVGLIPMSSDTSCPSSLRVGQEYLIFMDVKNTSSRQVIFYPDKVLLIRLGEKISFDLANTDHMILDSNEKQVYLETDKKQITLMPGDNIGIKLIVGDWSKIGRMFEIDLTEAFSSDENIRVKMEHLNAVRFGLILWD